MTAKILCIVPYPGLRNKVQHFFKQLTTENADLDIQIQIELANLANKNNLAALVKNNDFDLLLSRGGTVAFLEKQTNVPVIDIGISQYDIIRTIKSIPDLSESAIICYDAFDQAISQTLAQFNIKMTKYVVQKKMDIKNAMAKLAASGYHNIICDSGIIVASNNIYHLNSYLIESGDEVVYQALKTCFLLLREKETNINYFNLLSETLAAFHNYTLFFEKDNYFNVLFSTNKKKAAFLAKKVRKALSDATPIVTWANSSWHVVVTQTTNFSIATLDYLGKAPSSSQTHFDADYISSVYSTCYDNQFFKLLRHYSHLQAPVAIIGADGLEKEYLGSLIFKETDAAAPIQISLSDHESLSKALADNDSIFFDNHHLIQITGLEKLPASDQNDFFEFIRKSNLDGRNKLIFLITQPYGTKLNISFPDYLTVNELFLKPLNAMSYDVFNQLVHSILNDFNLKTGKTFSGISDTALDHLSSYPWPHNYREFIHVLTTALAVADAPILKGKDIDLILTQLAVSEKSQPEQAALKAASPAHRGLSLHDIIVQDIKQALKENNGNKTKTAKELNISRATLWRYLKR